VSQKVWRNAEGREFPSRLVDPRLIPGKTYVVRLKESE